MIRVGIIGTGIIAREHAHAIAMTDDVLSLAAAADLDAGRLHAFCRDFAVTRAFPDGADLIADAGIDLVAITTPPAAHEAAVVAALDEGKFVVCEKPLAHSMASAVRIAEAAARHPGRLTVSHQLRWHAPFQHLLWLCKNGWIGNIESAEIERHSYIPQRENGSPEWWGRWDIAGGGVLVTQVIHELDLLLLAMGRPARVTARADTRYTSLESEDYVDATFQFPGGRSARCIASVNSGSRTGSFALNGAKGSIRIPWAFKTSDPAHQAEAMRELARAFPDTASAPASRATRVLRAIARRAGMRERPELTPHAHLYLEVARSIAAGLSLPVPPVEALQALELCMGAYESAITGDPVAFPLGVGSAVYEGVSKELYGSRQSSPSHARA